MTQELANELHQAARHTGLDAYAEVMIKAADEIERLNAQRRDLQTRLEALGQVESRLRQAQGRLEALRLESASHLSGAVRLGHSWQRLVLAMQAAAIEHETTGNAQAAMVWIANTLHGPDLYPDVDEARTLGGTQAWFDAKMAEEEARLAAINADLAKAPA